MDDPRGGERGGGAARGSRRAGSRGRRSKCARADRSARERARRLPVEAAPRILPPPPQPTRLSIQRRTGISTSSSEFLRQTPRSFDGSSVPPDPVPRFHRPRSPPSPYDVPNQVTLSPSLISSVTSASFPCAPARAVRLPPSTRPTRGRGRMRCAPSRRSRRRRYLRG